jgi:hypothetical protein
VKRRRTGCFLCGGPCTTRCTDQDGHEYLGCDSGCRFNTHEEIEQVARPITADAVRLKISQMSNEQLARLWEKLLNLPKDGGRP